MEKENSRLIELENENRELLSTLEKLRKEEFDLIMEVAEIMTGDDQKQLVKGLRDDTEIQELKLKTFIDVTENNELNKTSHSKKVITEISAYIDELLAQKN